ncbi:MAG: hypothetical protein R3B54_07080 [Bdellovibrionota bacterium]
MGNLVGNLGWPARYDGKTADYRDLLSRYRQDGEKSDYRNVGSSDRPYPDQMVTYARLKKSLMVTLL